MTKGAGQCAPTGISGYFLSIGLDLGVPFLFDPDDFPTFDAFVPVVPRLGHSASVPVRIGESPAFGFVVLQLDLAPASLPGVAGVVPAILGTVPVVGG